MKKACKVPVVLQMEAVECGAASLTMILAYYKRFIPLEKMRIDCNVTRDGSTAKYIVKAAIRHGLLAKGVKTTVEALQQSEDFPMIIHWDFNHFVVLCGFEKDKAIINDPAAGRVQVDLDTFRRSFTGIALKFTPGEDFETCGQPKKSSTFLLRRTAGMKASATFVIVLGILYILISLLPPVFYKIFTDKILLGNSAEWMKPLVMMMLGTAFCGLVIGGLKMHILAKMKAKFRINSATGFMWKVLRLPSSYFAQRYSGDIVARSDNNEEIATLLFDQIIPAVMDLVLILFLMVLLFFLSPLMAVVVLAIGVLQVLVILYTSSGNANAARNIGRDYGKMSGMMLSGISMIETVKSSGAENGIVEKILGYQTKYRNSSLELTEKRIYLGVLPELLEGLSSAIILILGIYGIFQGKQTVGTLVAFLSFLNLFFQPLSSLTGCIQALQEVSGSVERIEDVMNFEEDIQEDALFSNEGIQRERLSGEVEVRHVSFGYSPVTEPLLKDFSIKAKPGDIIALSGGSGSGKSTLGKLLCGLYAPNEGEILYDGMPIQKIDHYVFTGSVAVVDQSISLFAGTIMENITMWNPDVDEASVIEACKDACIHEDILMRKDGYQYRVSEGGSDFSGGQRQRIEIARAFVVNPSVLILDEATSALDVLTEQKVMQAVKKRGITCFIVAHRLSTIRDADEIIMIERGQIVERGTHEELMELDGNYAALVRL